MSRPIALVTGVGRRAGIGAAIASKLAQSGWDVATTHWKPYDEGMPWGSDDLIDDLVGELNDAGGKASSFPADLSAPTEAAQLVDGVVDEMGPITALILNHAESVDSSIDDTTIEAFDRHFAVNVRASWLLIRSFARQFPGPHGSGRIVALTSDHTAYNLPYGASKGALERIVVASARELAHLGVTANAVNPGPTDTGWMSEELRTAIAEATPLGRVGRPEDAAELIAFLCSEAGQWINGQVLHSNGGFTGL